MSLKDIVLHYNRSWQAVTDVHPYRYRYDNLLKDIVRRFLPMVFPVPRLKVVYPKDGMEFEVYDNESLTRCLLFAEDEIHLHVDIVQENRGVNGDLGYYVEEVNSPEVVVLDSSSEEGDFDDAHVLNVEDVTNIDAGMVVDVNNDVVGSQFEVLEENYGQIISEGNGVQIDVDEGTSVHNMVDEFVPASCATEEVEFQEMIVSDAEAELHVINGVDEQIEHQNMEEDAGDDLGTACEDNLPRTSDVIGADVPGADGEGNGSRNATDGVGADSHGDGGEQYFQNTSGGLSPDLEDVDSDATDDEFDACSLSSEEDKDYEAEVEHHSDSDISVEEEMKDNVDDDHDLSSIDSDGDECDPVIDDPEMERALVAVNNANAGTWFRRGHNENVELRAGLLFQSVDHFRSVLADYLIQEGFEINRIKNEKARWG